MKKIIICLVALTLISVMSISAFAATGDTYTYEFGNKTVVFNSDTIFEESERVQIAQSLADDTTAPSTCGILCLFGHDYEAENVATITHCVYDTQPKCLKEIFEVKKCTRCDYTESELLSSAYIVCCE